MVTGLIQRCSKKVTELEERECSTLGFLEYEVSKRIRYEDSLTTLLFNLILDDTIKQVRKLRG